VPDREVPGVALDAGDNDTMAGGARRVDERDAGEADALAILQEGIGAPGLAALDLYKALLIHGREIALLIRN
jgi:hypothetical protein